MRDERPIFRHPRGENGTIRIALNRTARKALKKSKRPKALRIAYAGGRTEKLPLRLTR